MMITYLYKGKWNEIVIRYNNGIDKKVLSVTKDMDSLLKMAAVILFEREEKKGKLWSTIEPQP